MPWQPCTRCPGLTSLCTWFDHPSNNRQGNDVTPILLLLSTIFTAMLLLCSAMQPTELLSGFSLLASASILSTLMGNAACAAYCVVPGLSSMQRMAILTMVHALVLNTVPLCCRDVMPMWMLRSCIVVSTITSSLAGHVVLAAGGGPVAPSLLLPHVLSTGVLPLVLSMDLMGETPIIDVAQSPKSD